MRTDQSSRQRRTSQFGFHWHLLEPGINHVCTRAATPRMNGKVDRPHGIDSEELSQLLDGVRLDDTGLFDDKLQGWESYHDCHRPHGSLGGQTPYERLKQKTQAPT